MYLILWTLSLVVVAIGVACLELPAPSDWRLRLLAIYGLGNLIAYSLIPYKTPWCAISFAWPFLFVSGAAVTDLTEYAARQEDAGTEPAAAILRRMIAITAVAALAFSAFLAVRLNYFGPTDEKEPYVYVQTFPDMWKITDPMLELARQDPRAYHLTGDILCGSTYPLP